MLLLQELFVVWPCSSTGIKTPGQRRLSAGWKVWTAGLTVEDAGHLLFPPTFEWSANNKGLSAIRKGESESLTHGWWGDVSWPVIKKMNHITKAPGTRKLPPLLLLLFTPSHPTPSSLHGEKEETVSIYELIHYILSSDTHKKTYSATFPLPEVLDILRKWRDADAVKHSSWAFACLAFLNKQFRLYVIWQGRREKTRGLREAEKDGKGEWKRVICCIISREIIGGTLRRPDYQYKTREPIKRCLFVAQNGSQVCSHAKCT